MAARMTKDAIIQASVCKLAGLVTIVAAALLTANSFAQPQAHQEREQALSTWPINGSNSPSPGNDQHAGSDAGFQPLNEAASAFQSVAFWAMAALGLILLGLVVGAIATFVVLHRRPETLSNDDTPGNRAGPSLNNTKQHASEVANRIRSRIVATKIKLKLSIRRAARNTKRRLRRMVPSRRLVARFASLLLGIALVGLSLVGFSTGRVFESFIILPIGYAIAAGAWLLPGRSTSAHPNNQLPANSPAGGELPATRRAAIRPMALSPANPASVTIVPAQDLGFKFDATGQHQEPDGVHIFTTSAMENALQLVCGPCGKQYSVRGEGNINVRLIPCPQCGSAMETIGAQQTGTVPNAPDWVPIVSVFCKECRGLIDVPYASFGTSVACPRCQAELPVPRVAHEPRHFRRRGHFAQAL